MSSPACDRRGPPPTLPPLPAISARAIDYDNPEGLAATLRGAGCVVHLAGILFEGPQSSYQTANVDATKAVVDACKNAGVPRLVLVSVLGADPTSPNRYWRSKGRAERIVSESGLSGAIIRTGILLGPGMAGARAVVHAASQPARHAARRRPPFDPSAGRGRSEPCHPALL